MKVAFLFPGQGMETPRMGLALAAERADAAALLDRASEVTGQDLPRLLSRGGRALERTEVLQPVLTAVCLGALAALSARGCRADAVAGHSVGELPAWAAARGIAPAGAVDLAATRGSLMAQEAARHDGRMLAILGPREMADQALEEASAQGAVALAAENAPTEHVLSGDRAALESVAGRYASRFLPVAGAWHGPHMADAVEPLRRALVAAPTRPTQTPFLTNHTGREAEATALPDLLADQLVRPVRWAAVLATLQARGTTDYVTVGPGRVLRGLIRKNLGDAVRVHTTEDPADIQRTTQRLGAGGDKTS